METPSGLFGFGLPFLIILTVLVFVHEMGHYLIARWNGVRVEVFSVGFGPELFGWTDKRQTRWKFSLIPFGGYVKMFGDLDAASRPDQTMDNLTEEERAVAFPYKRLSQRTWIVAGGPLANYLFAILLFAGLYVFVGQPFTPPVVGEVLEGSAAEAAGILPGDRIEDVNGWTIDSFEQIPDIVRIAPGEEMPIVVKRDGRELAMTITPERVVEEDGFGNVQPIGRLGITSQGLEFVKRDPISALYWGTHRTVSLTFTILKALGQMITGDRSAKELGGPLRIFQMSGQMAETGIVAAVFFTALLSINLGLINLFPVPMLDGGHLMFYAIEGIRGRPLGPRAQEYGFRIGLALVLSLMVFATWNDIVHHLKIVEFIKGLVT